MILKNKQMKKICSEIAELLHKEQDTYKLLETLVEFQIMDSKHINLSDGRSLADIISIDKISKDEIMANPYLRDITIKANTTVGNIQLSRKRKIEPNKLIVYKETVRDSETFLPINYYFYCDRTLVFPSVCNVDEKIAWMTVEPREINAFADFIEEASGDVLLLGCGLGYVAYMLSLKDEVKSITVVDIDNDMLNMFNTHILPQFKNKEKIKTVLADGMQYLNDVDLNQFDYVNVDIWRTTDDMIWYYLPCLVVDAKYPNVRFSYWIEECLKEVLQKNILIVIANEVDGTLIGDAIYHDIAKYIVDNSSIYSMADIKKVIKLDNLRDILYGWFIEHMDEFFKMCQLERAKMNILQKLVNNKR